MRSILTTLCCSFLLLAGCSDSVSVETVAGSYLATTFTVSEGGAVEDLLSEGAILSITLAEGGATSGRLMVLGADEDGEDFDVNLTGTWSLDDSEVNFDIDADTFLDDMTFSFRDGRLTGERTFGSETVRVVLSR
jgi:hypothetical protein